MASNSNYETILKGNEFWHINIRHMANSKHGENVYSMLIYTNNTAQTNIVFSTWALQTHVLQQYQLTNAHCVNKTDLSRSCSEDYKTHTAHVAH